MSTPEEIKEQLVQILTQVAKTQNIENFEVTPDAESNYGDGFVAYFYGGEIRNKDSGKIIHVAIKKAPTWEFDYKVIFQNEDLFYRLAYPALNDLQLKSSISKPFDNIPKYFCAEMEPKKEYIAMENLKPLGYVLFDKMKYLDKDHLEIIFQTYGKFHALSYILRKRNLEKYDKIVKGFTDLSKVMERVIETQMINAVSAAVNALDPEKDKTVYNELQDFEKYVMKILMNSFKYTGEHNCLVHGDGWSNNMLFKYSESGKLLDIKLIDFQVCHDNTPIYDLSYFFYSGASKKDFDNLDNYLRVYYTSFSEMAKELGASYDEIFSFDELRNEWKEHAIFGVLMGIFLWQIKILPKQEVADAITGETVSNKSFDERFQDWEPHFKKTHESDLFKERTTAILRHAFEYGVLNRDKIISNKE